LHLGLQSMRAISFGSCPIEMFGSCPIEMLQTRMVTLEPVVSGFLSSLLLAASLSFAVPPLAQAAQPELLTAAPVKGLSQRQVEQYLSVVPALAIVNEDEQPFFTGREARGMRVAFFYLEPLDAIRELKLLKQSEPSARLKLTSLDQVYFPLVMGNPDEFGGTLRIRPSRRQIVEANRALQFNSPEGMVIPVTLDESKGQVPVFYSERVVLSSNGVPKYPFFFRKDDLDAAFRKTEAVQSRGSASSSKEAPMGLPYGLVRVATLEGLVRQMQNGEVDLSDAVLVPSPQALEQARALIVEQE